MLIPHEVETLKQKEPFANYILIGLTIVTYIVTGVGFGPRESMILRDFSPFSLVAYQFMHGSFWHIVMNMIVLWVFGNAICSNTNNLLYPVAYVLLGVLAGSIHLATDGGPVIGASGSICGIIGLYLAMYPRNYIRCVWFASAMARGAFKMRGQTLIVMWFLTDLMIALSGGAGRVAYWSHIGGYIGGFVTGIVLLHGGVVSMTRFDNPTVLDLITKTGRRKTDQEPSGTGMFDCEHCGASLETAPEEKPGDSVTCPSCGEELVVPAVPQGEA